MKNIKVIDKSGKTKVASIVRYYMYENKEYLIYFMNESEKNDRVRLYVVRIHPNFYGLNLTDKEWKKFQSLVRGIVKGYDDDISDIIIDDDKLLPIVKPRRFSIKVNYLEVLSGKESITIPKLSNKIKDLINYNRLNYQFETSKIDNPEVLSSVMYQNRYNELLKEHKQVLEILRQYEKRLREIIDSKST